MVKKFINGDTIIEVMMAITVFSGVIVMSLALMNQGVATAQGTLEVTLAREAMNAQAETLRFINSRALMATSASDDAARLWQEDIIGKYVNDGGQPSDLTACKIDTGMSAFVVNPRDPARGPTLVTNNNDSMEAPVYPRILYESDFDNIGGVIDTNKVKNLGPNDIRQADGIWIEAVKTSDARAYDFHIRACWYAPGKPTPNTLGTIIRLYNPSYISTSAGTGEGS